MDRGKREIDVKFHYVGVFLKQSCLILAGIRICENISFQNSFPTYTHRLKGSPAHLLSNLMHTLYQGTKYPKILCYFCNFQRTAQSKKSPNTFLGENSPNLVTLVTFDIMCTTHALLQPGLPDYSWYNIPKREKYNK
jgi:hypothetical protein